MKASFKHAKHDASTANKKTLYRKRRAIGSILIQEGQRGRDWLTVGKNFEIAHLPRTSFCPRWTVEWDGENEGRDWTITFNSCCVPEEAQLKVETKNTAASSRTCVSPSGPFSPTHR